VFRHLESGFCVLKVEARGRRETVTIVGHAPLSGSRPRRWTNERLASEGQPFDPGTSLAREARGCVGLASE